MAYPTWMCHYLGAQLSLKFTEPAPCGGFFIARFTHRHAINTQRLFGMGPCAVPIQEDL